MSEPAHDAFAGGETRRALQRLLSATEEVERPTVGAMVDSLGRSGHGLVLLMLALPSFIPVPGLPTGLVFGVALMLVAVQMIRGKRPSPCPNGSASRLFRAGRCSPPCASSILGC